jgi:hypothetical protein
MTTLFWNPMTILNERLHKVKWLEATFLLRIACSIHHSASTFGKNYGKYGSLVNEVSDF